VSFAEAETSAEVAVVRVAIGNGHLTGAQLREVLLLREEFAERGHDVGLLPLLRQRCLPASAIPELGRIYAQVLTGLDAKPRSYDPIPSGLMPRVSARARLRLDRHPAEDPLRVKAFISRVGVGLDAGSDAVAPPIEAEETAALVAKRPDSGRLGMPDSGRLAQASGGPTRPPVPTPPGSRRPSDSGQVIPHTADIPAYPRQVGSDSGPVLPFTAEASAAVDQNAATQAQSAVTRFGRYLVESEIARGGMGVVYKAKDPHLERYVALKVMQGEDGFELDPVDVERFVREAKATAKMRHPHIVSVLDTGTDHGHPYLVMDLVQGESIGERIKKGGPFDPLEAARLGAAIARALDYSHQQGVLHRDVKPNNILLEAERGTPLLTDFGLARKQSQTEASRLTLSGQAVGTPAYMAPEQATGESELLGPPTDVYGLGATLYHMLVGHPPFRGSTLSVMHAVLSEPAKPLRQQRASIPAELEAACMRCLAKDPKDRWQSAGELAAALERVGYSVPAPKAAAPEESTEPQSRRRSTSTRRPQQRAVEIPPPERVGPSSLALASMVVSACLVLGVGYYLFVVRPREAPDSASNTRPDDDPADPPLTEVSREDQALALLQALTDDPADGPVWQRKYQLARRWSKPAELPWQVAQGLKVAPSVDAEDVVVAVLLGLEDRFAEAGDFLGKGVQRVILRAELYAQARRLDEALELLNGVPNREVVPHRLRFLLWKNDFSAALVEAKSNLSADDPLRLAMEREAEVVQLTPLYLRIERIDAMLKDEPRLEFDVRGREHRAAALIKLGRFGEARQVADALEALRPGTPAAPYVHYFTHAQLGEPALALPWLESCISRQRNLKLRRELEFERVSHLAGLDLGKAKQAIAALLPVDDSLGVPPSKVADACVRTGHFKVAADYAQRALEAPGTSQHARFVSMKATLGSLVGLRLWKQVLEAADYVRSSTAALDPEQVPELQRLLELAEDYEAKAKAALDGE